MAAIEVRTRCDSESNGDSKWSYQFRNRAEGPADFVEQEDHAVPDSFQNGLGPKSMFTAQAGKRSAVFNTEVHGAFEQVRDIKIEILCVLVPAAIMPCAQDADGQPLNIKTFAAPPKQTPPAR